MHSLLNQGYEVVGTDLFPPEYDPTTAPLRKDFMSVAKTADNPGLYCSDLMKLALRNDCHDIIPLMDPEVDVLSERKEAFKKQGIKVWLDDPRVIRLVRNKQLWTTKIEKCDSYSRIPTFQSYKDLCANFAGRFVAKKICGRSSGGIFWVTQLIEVERMQ